MITLIPAQWRVLTHLQRSARRTLLSDIQFGSGLASKRETMDSLRQLQELGMVKLLTVKGLDGTTRIYAISQPTKGMVGVSYE